MRVEILEFGVRGSELELENGVWSLGFGVMSLEVGVGVGIAVQTSSVKWSLGFGVRRLKFAV